MNTNAKDTDLKALFLSVICFSPVKNLLSGLSSDSKPYSAFTLVRMYTHPIGTRCKFSYLAVFSWGGILTGELGDSGERGA